MTWRRSGRHALLHVPCALLPAPRPPSPRQALKGHGAPCRLVLLPYESHGYRAFESIMHTLYEQDQWLERCVWGGGSASGGRVGAGVGTRAGRRVGGPDGAGRGRTLVSGCRGAGGWGGRWSGWYVCMALCGLGQGKAGGGLQGKAGVVRAAFGVAADPHWACARCLGRLHPQHTHAHTPARPRYPTLHPPTHLLSSAPLPPSPAPAPPPLPFCTPARYAGYGRLDPNYVTDEAASPGSDGASSDA